MFIPHILEGADDGTGGKVVITSVEGEKIMIKLLLRCRDLFRGRNHSTGHVTLLNQLVAHNVNATYGEAVIQREKIRDKYKRFCRLGKLDSWHYAQVCRVIFDHEDPSVIPATQRSAYADYLEPLKDQVQVSAVSDGTYYSYISMESELIGLLPHIHTREGDELLYF